VNQIHDAATRYHARGWRLVVVEPFDKKALSKAWQNATPRPENFGAANNIGIKLGAASGGLVDIDLDIPQARWLAQEIPFFAMLPAFGREGEPPGHRLVICEDAPTTDTRFDLAAGHGLELPKDVVLELRANGQTVFPPSVLRRKGDGTLQKVVWAAGAEPGDIPCVNWDELQLRARVLALLAVVLAAYPTQGSRDETCMALGGTLFRMGLDPVEADDLIVTVARLAGDEEAEKRHGKAQAAATRHNEGGEVTGFPRLMENLGLQSCEAKMRRWLRLGKESKVAKTVPSGAIVAQEGDINRVIDEAEVALIARGEQIYQRGGELVRAVPLGQTPSDDGIRRPTGSTILLPVRASWLIQAMARSATWLKMGPKGPAPVDPAEKYATGLLARAGEWRFPVLIGVATAPTMDQQGRLIQAPGYDADSGLLLDFEEGTFPPIPERPTRDDAVRALAELRHPLRGFPFADDGASESVAVAAILTGLIRPAMEAAPLHAFDAPTAGTGKSLLTSVIGVIVTGREPAAMTQGKNPEEDEKRLVAAVRAGDPVLLIDNCEQDITGDFLCAMMTQLVVSVRPLGVSERLHLPCRALVLATGNNLRVAADMTRRTMRCRLDARVEQPEKRAFDFDCVAEARENRGALVCAALTILRAYVVAGRPGSFVPLGSFKDYDLVRGALMWLGMGDPDTSREQIVADDPARSLLADVLAAWHQVHGSRPAKVADMAQAGPPDDPDRQRLHELLVQVAGGRWDAPKIGRYLKANRDRPVDGLILNATKVGNTNCWSVMKVVGPGDTAKTSDNSAAPGRDQGEIPF
jgi:hypothetical protein